jgi:dynein heavy chain
MDGWPFPDPDSQVILQAVLSMRHVTPFRDAVASMLAQLSDVVDTLEIWIKVQLVSVRGRGR